MKLVSLYISAVLLLGTGTPYLCGTAHAGAGAPDMSFGNSGSVTASLGRIESFESVAVQPDGKIIGTGYVESSGSDYDMVVFRCDANGNPDPSFNGTGVVLIREPVTSEYGYCIGVQTDGKVVVGGYSILSDTSSFAVWRFNGDGTADTTFGGTGKVVTGVGNSNAYALAIAIQADGKIVAAGLAGPFPNTDFAVVRYNQDGALDTTFNSTGIVTTEFRDGGDGARAITVQPDGKIIVAGHSDDSNLHTCFSICRYTVSGTLDPTFNSTGKQTVEPGFAGNGVRSLVLQDDGKILAMGGCVLGPSDNAFAVVRLKADGTLDTDFNGTGIVTAEVGPGVVFPYNVHYGADGKISVLGGTNDGSEYTAAPTLFVRRYNSNGTFDSIVSASNILTGGTFMTGGMALQGDGRIVAAGNFVRQDPACDIAIARFLAADPLADARVGLVTAVPKGDDIYNTTGLGQVQKAPVPHSGGVKNVLIGIQNDSSYPDSFLVQGMGGNSKFAVKYFSGKKDVTGAITRGTYNTGSIAAGKTRLLRAKITAKTPVAGQASSFRIDMSSTGDPNVRDTAVIKARSN